MKIAKWRAVISLLLFITFVIVFFTGIGLHVAPHGWLAKANGWSFLGFSKQSLTKIHTLIGFVMSGLIGIHLILNFKLWLSEWKALFK